MGGQDSSDGTRRDGREVGEELLQGGETGAGWQGVGGMLWGQDLAAGGDNGARMGSVGTGKVPGGGGGLWDRTRRGRADSPGGAGRMDLAEFDTGWLGEMG